MNRGEKGRTRADNYVGFGGIEKFFPDFMAFGLSLFGVDKDNIIAKSGGKNRN